MGPQEARDALGGTSFATGLLMLSRTLGGNADGPLRANLFANAGAVGQSWAAAAGVGLSMAAAFGRVEINLSQPLAQSANSTAKPEPFQISFGVSMA